MQQTENIQLSPILEVSPVPFTMDTIGWKVLFLLVLTIIVYGIYNYYIFYKNNKYRRDAIVTVKQIASNNTLKVSESIRQIMFQIKQTAMHTYGRKEVAALKGSHWLKFLDSKVKGADFYKKKEVIYNSIYKDEFLVNSNFNKEEFFNSSLKWIKNHAR